MKFTPFFKPGERTRNTRLRYFSVRSSRTSANFDNLKKKRGAVNSPEWHSCESGVQSFRCKLEKRQVSVRELPCHRRGLGSNPRSDSICRLSLFLVPALTPRAILWFSLLFRKKHSIWLRKM